MAAERDSNRVKDFNHELHEWHELIFIEKSGYKKAYNYIAYKKKWLRIDYRASKYFIYIIVFIKVSLILGNFFVNVKTDKC